ncbi:cytochrome P460 family protein [Oricola cellulosilytica]|nr:cytochrome P460 family protein [Oricola cellulosilytica]
MRMKNLIATLAIGGVAVLGVTGGVYGQSGPPFGQAEDTDYAAKLWSVMEEMGLAGVTGENVIRGFPYEGIEPHGFVLDTLYATATIDGHSGALVVKRNYGPEGVSVEEVQADAAGHLAALTVMFKREDGYDDENRNWFWAKYLPDGSLDKNPAGVELAGRVVKGNAEAGCIACHASAGDDMLYTTDHIQ